MANDGTKRARVDALLAEGKVAGEIAREVECSREYVYQRIRARDGDPARSPSTGRLHLDHVEGSGRTGPPREAVIVEDDGFVLAEVGAEGRALLTLHEHGHGACCVRATRRQLDAVIARWAAVRDQLPVDPPAIEKIRDVDPRERGRSRKEQTC